MAQSVVTYFDNEDVLELLQQFKEYGVNMTYKGMKIADLQNVESYCRKNCRFNREIRSYGT